MSRYFFKVGDKDYLVDALRQFLYSQWYIQAPTPQICSTAFDGSMQNMVAQFRRHHGLSDINPVFSMDSLLDKETYRLIGGGMTDLEIALAGLHDAAIRVLLYGDPCGDWSDVPAVIPKEQFVGWGTEGVTKNCFDYCKAQLDKVGRSMKSTWWGPATKMSDHIYQLYLVEDVAGMKKGTQPRQFVNGVEYLKQAIKAKTPVVAGVEDGPGSPNADKVTDHFVTVVGMGTDAKGKYFHFYDNATGDRDGGTSANNRLYPDCAAFRLEGTADNDYARSTAYKTYLVSQVRESK